MRDRRDRREYGGARHDRGAPTGAESADEPQTLEPDPVSTGGGSRDSGRVHLLPLPIEGGHMFNTAMRDGPARYAVTPWRTIDLVTAAVIGVTFGVAYWGWSTAYDALYTPFSSITG